MNKEWLNEYKKAPITFTLIIICVVIYAITFVLYGSKLTITGALNLGGYNPVYVSVLHDYYRLFTANFLHYDLFHIFVNCYSLYGVGIFMERAMKPRWYLIVLVSSALATTGLPYLLYLVNGFQAGTVSVGISGVIFGLLGSLGALALKHKHIFSGAFKQVLPSIIFMLIFSVMIPTISLSGHVSGMIGGFVATWILLHIKEKPSQNYQNYIH